MSNLINSIERESFTLFISSNDKISGTNNNGQYLVNWDDFLPRGYNFFKMLFNFQTSGGYYKDFTTNVTTVTTPASIQSNVTTITITASNNNIAVGQNVTNTNIIQPCFVTAYTSGATTFTVNTPQTIPASQTLTFTTINTFAAAKIVFNTGGKSHSFDTKSKSQSSTLGYIQRDIQTSSSVANTLSCCYLFNAPKTISRPNQNVITISIYNTCQTTQSSGLLVDTNSSGSVLATDMSNWQMILEFIPIGDSIQPNHVNF